VPSEVGAPLMGCDPLRTGCAEAMAGVVPHGFGVNSLNNDYWPMVGLNEARLHGTAISSSSTLTIPDNAVVKFAALYWSADVGPGEQFTGDPTHVRLLAPGLASKYQDLTGEVLSVVKEPVGGSNSVRTYYESFKDVTTEVQLGGAGKWSVADIAYAGNSHTDRSPSYYAGWALVVVYEDGAHLSSADVTVYDGAALVASGSSQTFAINADPSSALRIGVVAWEGDRGLTGDELQLSDGDANSPWTALTPMRGSTTLGTSDNAFDSTALGSEHPNTFGVDVKGFVPVQPPAAKSTIRVTSSGDRYVLGALTTWTPWTAPTP